MALGLAAALAGCNGQLPLHNPKPSPYGHGDRGTLFIDAASTVCWGLYVQQQDGVERPTGCGKRTVPLHRYGFFVVFVTKTDSTGGALNARIVSGGRVIRSGSTTTPNQQFQLIG